MLNVVDFKSWLGQLEDVPEEEILNAPCDECDGEGVVYEDCACCGQETEKDCWKCDGDGRIEVTDTSEQIAQHLYFKECIETIRRYCHFTGADFLVEVGDYIAAHGRPSRRHWRHVH